MQTGRIQQKTSCAAASLTWPRHQSREPTEKRLIKGRRDAASDVDSDPTAVQRTSLFGGPYAHFGPRSLIRIYFRVDRLHALMIRNKGGAMWRCIRGFAFAVGLVAAFSFSLFRTHAAEEPDASAGAKPGSANESELANQLHELESRIRSLRASGRGELADQYESQLRRTLSSLLRRSSEQLVPAKSAVEKQLANAVEKIKALRASEKHGLADRVEKQLAVYQAALTGGEFNLPRSDEPEVHWIQLGHGTALPKEFEDRTNRRTVGYSEVLVDYPSRPVVLVLSGSAPILWNINVAPESRIHAVVLTGRQQQVVTQPSTLVFHLQSARDEMAVQDFTGRPVATRQNLASFPGKPIVVGPRSAKWLNTYLLPRVRQLAATVAQLREIFEGREEDVTEENIQARCRGLLLMSISNKTGRMLLTTGNKSEMAVGYATLYGDMAGGFAPIRDCSKTLVYRLARYRNTRGEVIPERIISRPPSAELRPNQKDTDSLPAYDVLDPILEAFIEKDLSVDEIVDQGYDRDVVVRILELVKRNEYKRRQAPPGIRISGRAFGRDWRYPITSRYTFPE